MPGIHIDSTPVRRLGILMLALVAFDSLLAGETTDRVQTDDGIELRYEVRGEGDRFLMVPLARMVGDLTALEADFRIVAYDPRGRGRSSGGVDVPISMELDLQDLEWLRTELGIERTSLLGISYYGALVARYAARYPDRVDQLVLLAPMALSVQSFEDRPREGDAPEGDLEESIAPAEPAGPSDSGVPDDPRLACRYHKVKGVADLYFDTMRFDPADLAICDLDNELPAAMGRWAGQLFTALGRWDFGEELRGVAAPSLVVQGANDRITPPSGGIEWSNTLRNAQLLWMEECGHLPWKEHPDRVRSEVRDFLGEDGSSGLDQSQPTTH